MGGRPGRGNPFKIEREFINGILNTMKMIVATFYKFIPLPDFRERKIPLLKLCEELEIKGTILLALEGINGTISGSEKAINSILNFLRSTPHLSDLEVKFSPAEFFPFQRMKVKLKKEIVTLGVPTVDPTQQVGIYVSPQEWNELIQNPEVVLIDTRNQYEVNLGTFKGAQDPHLDSFRQFPEYIQQHFNPEQCPKVALFCTGGIRCEKATSWMLSQGFQEVYHLQGGILRYLAEIRPEESLWEGECFVFDERITVEHQSVLLREN